MQEFIQITVRVGYHIKFILFYYWKTKIENLWVVICKKTDKNSFVYMVLEYLLGMRDIIETIISLSRAKIYQHFGYILYCLKI